MPTQHADQQMTVGLIGKSLYRLSGNRFPSWLGSGSIFFFADEGLIRISILFRSEHFRNYGYMYNTTIVNQILLCYEWFLSETYSHCPYSNFPEINAFLCLRRANTSAPTSAGPASRQISKSSLLSILVT